MPQSDLLSPDFAALKGIPAASKALYSASGISFFFLP